MRHSRTLLIACLGVTLALGGCTIQLGSPESEASSPETKSSSDDAAKPGAKRDAKDAGGERPERAALPKGAIRELGSFTNRYQMVNKYVLVERGLTRPQLVGLARALHRAEPKVTFWMLDDASQFERMLRAIRNVDSGQQDTVPLDWASEHVVANIQMWANGDWFLCEGLGYEQIEQLS